MARDAAWNNDSIQFPRLITELEQAGVFTDAHDAWHLLVNNGIIGIQSRLDWLP